MQSHSEQAQLTLLRTDFQHSLTYICLEQSYNYVCSNYERSLTVVTFTGSTWINAVLHPHKPVDIHAYHIHNVITSIKKVSGSSSQINMEQ